MLTLEKLNEFGADTGEGLGRCMNNEAFYFRMIGILVKDANFGMLEDAVEANDLDAAFEASHALKGVLGNLSMTPMAAIASEMCELLRSRKQMDYTPMLEELLAKKAELEALMAD